jgi:hypothetical protein
MRIELPRSRAHSLIFCLIWKVAKVLNLKPRVGSKRRKA